MISAMFVFMVMMMMTALVRAVLVQRRCFFGSARGRFRPREHVADEEGEKAKEDASQEDAQAGAEQRRR